MRSTFDVALGARDADPTRTSGMLRRSYEPSSVPSSTSTNVASCTEVCTHSQRRAWHNKKLICTLDLKPENLIFRTKAEDADIMIADFGLSRVMDDEKFQMLTEICGTPGVSTTCSGSCVSAALTYHAQYMAPEIFKKSTSSSEL